MLPAMRKTCPAFLAPVPHDESPLDPRSDVDVDEVAAVSAEPADFGLTTGPGVEPFGVDTCDDEIRGLAPDVLRAVADESPALVAPVFVDPSVIRERPISRDDIDRGIEMLACTHKDSA